MNWIIFLTKNRISYHVYKLNQGDSIILNKKQNNHKIIVLTGIISLAKLFCNKKLLPIATLSNNDVITNHKNKKTSYRIIALKTSYIITVNDRKSIEKNYEQKIKRYYEKTINKYEETINLMHQQNKKTRILIFILLIFLRFGKIKEYNIVIPFKLKKDFIANVTATSSATVDQIIKRKYINQKGKFDSINIKNLKLI